MPLAKYAPVIKVTESAINPHTTRRRLSSSKNPSDGKRENSIPNRLPFICRSSSRYITATPVATANAASPSRAIEMCRGSSGRRTEFGKAGPPCVSSPGTNTATAIGVRKCANHRHPVTQIERQKNEQKQKSERGKALGHPLRNSLSGQRDRVQHQTGTDQRAADQGKQLPLPDQVRQIGEPRQRVLMKSN